MTDQLLKPMFNEVLSELDDEKLRYEKWIAWEDKWNALKSEIEKVREQNGEYEGMSAEEKE